MNMKWIKVAQGIYNLMQNDVVIATVENKGTAFTGSYCPWIYSIGEFEGIAPTLRSGKFMVQRVLESR